jgi:hypothetical protein
VEFTDVTARRADGTPLAIGDFVADGLRWWPGLLVITLVRQWPPSGGGAA